LADLQRQLKQNGNLAVITAESISQYYAQPALRTLLTTAAEKGRALDAPEDEVYMAALYAISQLVEPKQRWGSVADLTALWAVRSAEVKKLLGRCEFKQLMKQVVASPKEIGALLSQEPTEDSNQQGKTGRRRKSPAEAEPATKAPSPFAWPVHPLAVFSCATSGHAFGSLFN